MQVNGEEFETVLRRALAAAHAARQRRLLVLSGAASWARKLARIALARTSPEEALWVGEGGLAVERLATRLGRECQILAYDAHAGFDPDGFGIASGLIRGGGLLLLLTPSLPSWPKFDDPQRQRIAVWPDGVESVAGRYLERLARLLREDPQLYLLEQGRPPRLPVEPAVAHAAEPGGEQRQAVAALLRVARGHRKRPLVLLADRGRGKSAALGLAAAELLRTGARRIVITGPRLDATEAAFRHAAAALGEAELVRGELRLGEARLRFVAPDALALAPEPAELVLVDEAAAIPTPLLTRLLEHYPRIAFASTVHGYEGTGRGFILRFSERLDALTPGWRLMRLREPLRWAEDDPLERFTFRALLLDAEPAPDEELATAAASTSTIERVDRDALARDERSLRELFGLLVLAHYRTRPFDLRQLLDGPNLSLWLARHRGRIVAAALVAAEGELEPALAVAVAEGRRRVRGHLLPQALAAHLGLVDAASLRCARILRIAVHPACQGRGIGGRLLAELAEEGGWDLLGSSFGATPALLRFWGRGGYEPVRIGATREAVSGERAALVLRVGSAAGDTVRERARERFAANLPYQLGEPLADLEPALVLTLLETMQPAPPDPAQLAAFAAGGRSYEDALGALWRFAVWAGAGRAALDDVARSLLVVKLLQRRDWGVTARLFGLSGRAQVLERLRLAARAAPPPPEPSETGYSSSR